MVGSTFNSNQITLPTPEEMEKAVAADKLSSSSPQAVPSAATLQAAIELANTPEDQVSASQEPPFWSEWPDKFRRHFPKVVAIGLTFQSLRGLYNSAAFILVDYPLLEQKLVTHQITEAEVSELTIIMIMVTISTIVGLVFAMRLTLFQTTAAKRLNIIIGLLLFFGNPFIHDFIQATNLSEWLTNFFAQSVQTLHVAPEQVLENAPFLEGKTGGELEAVWYK